MIEEYNLCFKALLRNKAGTAGYLPDFCTSFPFSVFS